jgi:hypothetical protein
VPQKGSPFPTQGPLEPIAPSESLFPS